MALGCFVSQVLSTYLLPLLQALEQTGLFHIGIVEVISNALGVADTGAEIGHCAGYVGNHHRGEYLGRSLVRIVVETVLTFRTLPDTPATSTVSPTSNGRLTISSRPLRDC